MVVSFCQCVPSPIWIRTIERTDSISWRSPATPICSPGHEPSPPWSRIPLQTAETSLRHSQDIPPVPFCYVFNKCGRPEVAPGGQRIFSVHFFCSAAQMGALPRRPVFALICGSDDFLCSTGTSQRFDDRVNQKWECHRRFPRYPHGRSSADANLARPTGHMTAIWLWGSFTN